MAKCLPDCRLSKWSWQTSGASWLPSRGCRRQKLAEETAERFSGEIQAQTDGDDLTEIKGIGPVFASRLATAGIGRFAILAAAEPKEVALAAGVREWQNADIDDWIAQARVLARRPRRVQIGDDLTRVEGIGPAYAIRLRAAGITTFAQLAGADETALSAIIGAPSWRRINYGDRIAQARLAAAGDEAGLKALQDELNRRKGDNLALIKGIGEATAAALRQAGITDYGTLANTPPETLKEIVKQHGLRGGDYAAWVAEARLRVAGKRIERAATRSRSVQGTTERSCPQDLEAVRGIGQAYEQRLYAVGIGTYWELGMVPSEELEAILDIRDFQDVDLAAIQAAAMQLAAETETMGHTWDGSEPDDFEIMEGIGPVLERRLYAAGICTYAALAGTTPGELAAICRAPTLHEPDYMRWIEQAQARLAQGLPSA